VIGYCLSFPELCHHPKEDLVFPQARDNRSRRRRWRCLDRTAGDPASSPGRGPFYP
jgi:hypothetical protein